MDRRGFFKNMALTVGGILASSRPAGARAAKRVELQVSPVAGFRYHAGPGMWENLLVGAPAELVREPENEDDPRAVRVELNGTMLGYLPRNENSAPCHLLDSGKPLSAKISRLNKDGKPWERVWVRVWMG